MSSVLSLTPSYYQALLRLTVELAGVNLGKDHEFLIETRLGALARREGFENLNSMIEELFSTGQSRLAVQVVSTLLERDIQFYEDADGYDTLVKTIIPSVLGQTDDKTIRILSFGCSSGQEAYSVAMKLDQLRQNRSATSFEIVGVDYPSQALDRARAGQYTHFEVQRGLPATDLVRYFERKGEDWIVNEKLRAAVTFQDVHLLSKLDDLGEFHIIMFKNALPHYSKTAQLRVLRSLTGIVKYEGYLILGRSENLNQFNFGFDAVPQIPGVFRREAEPVIEIVDPSLKVPTGRTTFEKADEINRSQGG